MVGKEKNRKSNRLSTIKQKQIKIFKNKNIYDVIKLKTKKKSNERAKTKQNKNEKEQGERGENKNKTYQ